MAGISAGNDPKRPSPQLPPYLKVTIYAEFGKKDKALETLDRMYEEREGDLQWIKVDPRLDGLRQDPRFQDLLKRMGLSS